MRIYKNQDELRIQLHEKLDIGLALKFLSRKKPEKQTIIETKIIKTLDKHTVILNNIIRKFNSLEKKGIEKALDYFSEKPEDKKLLLEAVSVKKEKTVKSIDDKIQKIDKRLKALKEIKNKLIKDKKKKNELERIESLFR